MTHQAAQSEIQGVPHHHPSLPPPPDCPVVARDQWCDGSPCIWCLTGKLCNLSYLGWTDLFAPPFTREINPWWLRLPVDTPDQSEASIQASWSLLTNQIPVDTPDWTPEHRWHEKLIHYPKLGLTFIQGVDSLQAKTHDAHFPIKV